MMLKLVLITIWWITTSANFNPPECPENCDCQGPTITCEGGRLPKLDKRLTRFTVKDANPHIKILTKNITQNIDQLVSFQVVSVGLGTIECGALAKIKRLENLEITYNDIKKLTAEAFTGCNNLVLLNLESNGIQVIENDTFKDLPALKNLSLAHNAITVLPQMLPEGVQKLNFEDNRIEEIHTLVFHNLTSLNICKNKILKIENDQMELKSLAELCLGNANFMVDPTLVNSEKFPVLESLQLVGENEGEIYINGMTQRNILHMASRSLRNLTIDSCILPNMEIFNMHSGKLQTFTASNVMLPSIDRIRGSSTEFSLGSVEIFDMSGSPGLARLFINTPARVSLPELRVLRLSQCNITTFPQSVFQSKTPNVTQLDISHNPFNCACFGLSWIQDYVKHGHFQLIKEEATLCATPDHLHNITLLTATLCPSQPVSTTPKVITVNTTVNPNTTIAATPPAITFNISTTAALNISSSITSTKVPVTTEKTTRLSTTLTFKSITEAETSIPSHSTLPLTSARTTNLLPTTITPSTIARNFTIENITDASTLQRPGFGGINKNNNGTERTPPLPARRSRVLNIVAVVLAALLVIILITAGVVHYRKRQSRHRSREGNMVSMAQIGDPYEPLI